MTGVPNWIRLYVGQPNQRQVGSDKARRARPVPRAPHQLVQGAAGPRHRPDGARPGHRHLHRRRAHVLPDPRRDRRVRACIEIRAHDGRSGRRPGSRRYRRAEPQLTPTPSPHSTADESSRSLASSRASRLCYATGGPPMRRGDAVRMIAQRKAGIEAPLTARLPPDMTANYAANLVKREVYMLRVEMI